MSRWGARLLLVIMLVMFAMVFSMMYRQLVSMQRAQQQEGTTTR